MAKSIYEKIWDAHLVHEEPGQDAILYIDRHFVHEVTSPQAFEGLRLAGRKVRRPELTFATMDHNIPTTDRSRPIDDPLSAQQVETLAQNCRDFGIRCFDMHDRRSGIVHIIGPELGITQPGQTIVCGDGTRPPFRAAPAAPFEAVLVDAPCSGLGVLRRRADARWRKGEAIVAEMATLQRALLAAASALVRPGGIMVYSVCSFEPEETDATVKEFLGTHSNFVQEDARPYAPPAFRGQDAALRAYPHVHGTDGVYAVRLRRR